MYLRISYVGYKTKYVELEESPLQIRLEPLRLSEVVVVARQKLYVQKSGEMIANVKGTILETLPKTADIIAQLPLSVAKTVILLSLVKELLLFILTTDWCKI